MGGSRSSGASDFSGELACRRYPHSCRSDRVDDQHGRCRKSGVGGIAPETVAVAASATVAGTGGLGSPFSLSSPESEQSAVVASSGTRYERVHDVVSFCQKLAPSTLIIDA